EADDQKVIDGIREAFVAQERVDEEHAAVAAQCAGHPEGQRDADAEIGRVGGDDVAHVSLLSLRTGAGISQVGSGAAWSSATRSDWGRSRRRREIDLRRFEKSSKAGRARGSRAGVASR